MLSHIALIVLLNNYRSFASARHYNSDKLAKLGTLESQLSSYEALNLDYRANELVS